VALLLGGGWLWYRGLLRPDPQRLETWATAALQDVFGPETTHGRVEVDLLGGVQVYGLRVPSHQSEEPALWADSVEIQHDVLALSAGVLRLRRLVLRGPRISTHELETGEVELDFPFDPPKSSGKAAPMPEIEVAGGEFVLRASAQSKRFRPGFALRLERFHGTAKPLPTGGVAIKGGFSPAVLGFSGPQEIEFEGSADVAGRALDVVASWKDVKLTPELRSILAPDLAARLDPEMIEEGPNRLVVHLMRDPAVEAGRLRVVSDFEVRLRPSRVVTALPGVAENIDAHTAQEIDRILKDAQVRLRVSGTDVDIQALESSLMGGEVSATGKVTEGGKGLDLVVRMKGVRLEDEGLRQAFGTAAQELLASVDARGRVDAEVRLRRENGGPVEWSADFELRDATLRYLGRTIPGKTTPSGRPMKSGFPYAAEHVNGKVHLRPGSLTLETLEGTHGTARIRILGAGQKGLEAQETGFVRWDEAGTTVRLTVEATKVPIDDDVRDAVESSEIAGALDVHRLAGVVDRVLVDVSQDPDDPKPLASLGLRLEDAGYSNRKFPLPLEHVQATIRMTRPKTGPGVRDQKIAIDAEGDVSGGGRVRVVADLAPIADRGRIRVWAKSVPLERGVAETVLTSEAGEGGLADAFRFLSPSGLVDVTADAPAYEDPVPASYWTSLRGVGISLRGRAIGSEPAPTVRVEDLTGLVTVKGKDVSLADIEGKLAGRTVRLAGTLEGGPAGAWDVSFQGRSLVLSPEILAVLDTMAPGGSVFPEEMSVEAGGRLDLFLRVKRPRPPPGGAAELSVIVDVRRADLVVHLGALSARVRGDFRVEPEGIALDDLLVEGDRLSIRANHARFGSAGLEGRVVVALDEVPASPGLLSLLPSAARDAISALAEDRLFSTKSLVVSAENGAIVVRGDLALLAAPGAPPGGAPRGRFTFAPLRVTAPAEGGRRVLSGTIGLAGAAFDAGAHLSEAFGTIEIQALDVGGTGTDAGAAQGSLALERVRVEGMLVQNLASTVVRENDRLSFGSITGQVYGGTLAGTVTVLSGPPTTYTGRVTVDGARIETAMADLSKRASEASGLLHLDAVFAGGDESGLTAQGSVSVTQGDLGELPAVATLPALLSRVFPGSSRPRFTCAEAEFTIADDVVDASWLHLSGPLFDVTGSGTITFGGDLDLTLRPQILKSFLLPGALRVPVVGDVLSLFREDALYVVKVTGSIDDPQTKLVPFPALAPRRAPVRYDPLPPPAVQSEPLRRVPSSLR
jgi:hypothetical protein